MREILFRGKAIDGGKWLYGDYQSYAGTAQIWENTTDGEWNYLVQPETVGQYTGQTDKNAKKIFEADIVLVDGEYGVVGWDDEASRFMILVDGRIYAIALDRERGREVEVVGNIFDNPELLKGGDNND